MLKPAASLCLLAALAPLPGTTLQQLTLDALIQKSTSIVRGTAQPGLVSLKGSILYTHYSIQVSEQWKGNPSSRIDVAVPGGALNGRQQTYSGAPVLTVGREYVLFLWTSPGRLTQVIGLSQGLFNVATDGSGNLVVTHTASQDQMVDAAGHVVSDSSFSMGLTDLKNRISSVLSQRSSL